MRSHVSDETFTNVRRRNALVPRVVDRVALSLMVGFVATIIITGLYSVSTTQIYSSPCRAVYVQNSSSGFPLDWLHLTFPSAAFRGGRCANGSDSVLSIPKASASVDFGAFGLDVLLYSFMLLPLTRTSRPTPRLNAGLEREPGLQNLQRADDLRRHELVVIAASTLSLVWMILYYAGIAQYLLIRFGLEPLSSEAPFDLSLTAPLLLVYSLIGIFGSLWSTWRFVTGGVLLAIAGFFMILLPQLAIDMFILNPEFGMLYLLWTSTMLAGGLGAILVGVHHTYVRRVLNHKGQAVSTRLGLKDGKVAY